jgi:acyl carrier protein
LKKLKDKLPDYMIPSVLLRLEELPLTTSGKVNRNALPIPTLSREELGTEYIAPRNEDEEKLVAIVEELLSIENVGIKDNFFELGGHSLLATQFISRVRDEFNKEIKLLSLFEDPTIEGVYINLQKVTTETATKRPTISKISRDSRRIRRTDIN